VHSVDFYEENAGGLMLEQFVVEYQPLVKKIALYIKHRLPSHVSLDDLTQSGFVGLLEARRNYKNNMGATFETYASIRIRGAIMDALRKSSWSTRESSRNMRKISDAISTIEQRDHRQPSTEEIITELGISAEEHMKMSQQISIASVVSLDVLDSDQELFGDAESDPETIIQEEDIKQYIKHILVELPEREQLVLALYYVEEFTLKQIGEILDLTEARVCQLHSQSLARLRAKMRSQKVSAD
jgi:RNA polymerase sigma factor for flagellar operon FliA